MLKISITVNPNKDKNLASTLKLLSILREYSCKIFMSDNFKKPYGAALPLSETILKDQPIEYVPEYLLYRKAALCIVFGGDGTILKIAKRAAASGAYIIGINLGRVGYLAELETNELDKLRPLLAAGDLTDPSAIPGVRVDNRMMITAEIIHNDTVIHSATVLNDVVISKGAVSRMAGLKVYCDGNFLSHYRADGIIVSTPTGSTAYCMSAGGPIMDPHLSCLCAIPVCPYMCVNSGAVLFSDSSVIDIRFTADKINEAFCTFDGRGVKTIRSGDVVRIRKAQETARLLHVKDVNFYMLLNRKLTAANDLPESEPVFADRTTEDLS